MIFSENRNSLFAIMLRSISRGGVDSASAESAAEDMQCRGRMDCLVMNVLRPRCTEQTGRSNRNLTQDVVCVNPCHPDWRRHFLRQRIGPRFSAGRYLPASPMYCTGWLPAAGPNTIQRRHCLAMQHPNDDEQKRRLLYNALTLAKRSCTVVVQAQRLVEVPPFAG